MARREFASGPSFRAKFGSETTTSDFSALAGVSRSRAWTLTTLAMLALAVTLVDRQVLAALASTVTSALGISDLSYGVLSSGFATAYLLGSLPASRVIDRIGPRVGLIFTLAASSLVIGLHAFVHSFAALFALRALLGLVVAASFPCAMQAIHRLFPFKDRARAMGFLYFGNSLGSAACAPLSVAIEAHVGWRAAFGGVALLGVVWIPIWVTVAWNEGARLTLDEPALHLPGQGPSKRASSGRAGRRFTWLALARERAVLRGALVVAAAAPVTTVMLLWGSKYLVRDHHLSSGAVGRFLWLPALFFGAGSLAFGELRARSAKSRSKAVPPRRLMAIAASLAVLLTLTPWMRGPSTAILVASLAMAGAGGLYTLATSDMLAHAPRGTVPAITGFTTLTQSLVYIVVNPVIGKTVEHFHDYTWVMVGAGLWVLPGVVYWFVQTSQVREGTAPIQ